MDSLVSYSTSSHEDRMSLSDSDEEESCSQPTRPATSPETGSNWTLDVRTVRVTSANSGKRGREPETESGLPCPLQLLQCEPSELARLSVQQQQSLGTVLLKLQQLVGDDLQPATSEASNADSNKGLASHKDTFPVLVAYHLSLSHVVPIRFHNIQPLIDALRQHLAHTSSFTLELSRMSVFVNGARTRTFVAMEAVEGAKQFTAVVRRVDDAFRGFGFQTFHECPRPHASVAWLPGGAEKKLCGAVEKLRTEPEWHVLGKLGWATQVEEISCRVGQKLHTIWKSNGVPTS